MTFVLCWANSLAVPSQETTMFLDMIARTLELLNIFGRLAECSLLKSTPTPSHRLPSARLRVPRLPARRIRIELRRLAAVEHAVVAHHADAAQPRAILQ